MCQNGEIPQKRNKFPTKIQNPAYFAASKPYKFNAINDKSNKFVMLNHTSVKICLYKLTGTYDKPTAHRAANMKTA